MRKNTAIITIRVSEQIKAALALLKKNNFSPGNICREGIEVAVNEAMKRIKKTS